MERIASGRLPEVQYFGVIVYMSVATQAYGMGSSAKLRLLVAHAHGAEHVADVESEEISVRHADAHLGDSLLEHVVRTVTGVLPQLVHQALPAETLLQILVVVVERDTDDEAVAVLAQPVRDIGVRNVVRHHDRPVDGAHQRIQLVVRVSHGVQAAHEAAHAGARDDVDRDPQFFQVLDHAEVRQAARAAAREHEAHGGTVLADGIHPLADPGEGRGIGLRVGALQDLRLRAQRE